MNGLTRIRILPSAIVSIAVALVVLSTAGSSVAQETSGSRPPDPRREHAFRLDARAGIAVPLADLRDYVDEGPVMGTGLAYDLGGRTAIRADWSALLMRPADREPLRNKGVDIPLRGSETDLHHLTGGAQVRLSEPGAMIEVRAHGGAGVTFLSTEETELAEGGDFTQFTLDVGLELAVPLDERIRFIGRGDLYLLPFRAGAPDHLLKEITFPFSGGLAVGL